MDVSKYTLNGVCICSVVFAKISNDKGCRKLNSTHFVIARMKAISRFQSNLRVALFVWFLKVLVNN